MKLKKTVGSGALFSFLFLGLVGCGVEAPEEQTNDEPIGQTSSALTVHSPQCKSAYISSDVAGKYTVPPDTSVTAHVTWKNPCKVTPPGFDTPVTCLQVTEDGGPWGLVDCENTGDSVRSTKGIDWIVSGHTYQFGLMPYAFPKGHAPTAAAQGPGIVSFLIDTR